MSGSLIFPDTLVKKKIKLARNPDHPNPVRFSRISTVRGKENPNPGSETERTETPDANETETFADCCDDRAEPCGPCGPSEYNTLQSAFKKAIDEDCKKRSGGMNKKELLSIARQIGLHVRTRTTRTELRDLLDTKGHKESAMYRLADTGKKKVPIEVLSRKPVLYLYSKVPFRLTVELKTDHENSNLSNIYPAPDVIRKNECIWENLNLRKEECDGYYGSIIEHHNRAYPYLHWDIGYSVASDEHKEGSMALINFEDIPEYLEHLLSEAGLNPREITDFITYWIHEFSKYASVSFSLIEPGGTVRTIPSIPLLRVWVSWKGYRYRRPVPYKTSTPINRDTPRPRDALTYAVEWGAFEMTDT
jgi:hypothetical protein